MVREKKKEKNSLENNLDDPEPKNHEQVFDTSTIQSSSTKIDGKKGNLNLKLIIIYINIHRS